MKIKATQLRQNIYKILDSALETGRLVEVERKGKIIKIVPPKKESKLARLEKHECMKDNPESFVHMDWSNEWEGEI